MGSRLIQKLGYQKAITIINNLKRLNTITTTIAGAVAGAGATESRSCFLAFIANKIKIEIIGSTHISGANRTCFWAYHYQYLTQSTTQLNHQQTIINTLPTTTHS